MNPPFRLGPANLLNPPTTLSPNPFTFRPLEVSAAAVFTPGQGVEGQAHASWRMHPNLFARLGLQSSFTDRLALNIQAGGRLSISDFMSLEGGLSGGLGWAFGQELTQGRLAEGVRREGMLYYLGTEIRLNADLGSRIGLYVSASYLREFCGDVQMTPARLPYSQETADCEGANLVSFAAGVRVGFLGGAGELAPPPESEPPAERLPEEIIDEEPVEATPPLRLRDLVDGSLLAYIRQIRDITGIDTSHAIETLAQEAEFRRLPAEFQQVLVLAAIHDPTPGPLRRLCYALSDLDHEMLGGLSGATLSARLDSIRALLPLPLNPLTVQELHRLIPAQGNDYALARQNLATAYLHATLNPFARDSVRRFIGAAGRELGIQTEGLTRFNPPLVSVEDDRLATYCHTRDPLLGCANAYSELSTRKAYISLTRRMPDEAYETIIHENEHLYASRMRELSGCNPSYFFSLEGRRQAVPTWLEEAMNEEESSDIYRMNGLDYTEIEANADGREALSIVNGHQSAPIASQWRSLHLFCRAEGLRQSLGPVLFRRLTSAYPANDFEGTTALNRVRAYYRR